MRIAYRLVIVLMALAVLAMATSALRGCRKLWPVRL